MHNYIILMYVCISPQCVQYYQHVEKGVLTYASRVNNTFLYKFQCSLKGQSTEIFDP